MHKFGKVVLSRKGFDSSAGGGYSPFDPQTGKYIVLPIPYGEIGKYIGNRTRYEQIKIKPNYLPEIDAETLKDLINSKALGFGNKVKKVITNKYAHFDPWLVNCPWLAGDSNHPIGAFGQVGGAQTHLHNQGAGEGSLFLFFSRFTPIKNRENIILHDIISREHLGKGLYFIYGWLKIVNVITEFEDIDNSNLLSEKDKTELKERHPHATKDYFDKCKGKNNTIYIADSQHCGYFPKLTNELLLTATDSAQKSYNNWIAGRWELPDFFYTYPPTHFLKDKQAWTFQRDSKTCVVKHPNIGQEFVFDDSEDFRQWFRRLLEQVSYVSPTYG